MSSSTLPILIIHGPNLNLLGEREVSIYGNLTLDAINQQIEDKAKQLGVTVQFFQSNHEGELIDAVQKARNNTSGIIINPGGYTHTSVALRDALAAYSHPKIEVHLSNIFQREPFRRHSFISGVVNGVITGLGTQGYILALEAVSPIAS